MIEHCVVPDARPLKFPAVKEACNCERRDAYGSPLWIGCLSAQIMMWPLAAISCCAAGNCRIAARVRLKAQGPLWPTFCLMPAATGLTSALAAVLDACLIIQQYPGKQPFDTTCGQAGEDSLFWINGGL
jgi:hypothetical protein